MPRIVGSLDRETPRSGNGQRCCALELDPGQANALDPSAFTLLMGEERAAMVFTDPPYNVPIEGHARSFARCGGKGNLLPLHPTVKPVAMVADAILDCSARGEIVLDAFLGSGTTVIAAERTGRRVRRRTQRMAEDGQSGAAARWSLIQVMSIPPSPLAGVYRRQGPACRYRTLL